jgi:hypothetical protein
MKIEEIDLDFIGGEGVLTAVEEKELRDYFKQQKLIRTIESQPKSQILGKKAATKKRKLLSTAT